MCRARVGALAAAETGSEIWGANPEEGFKVTKDETIVGSVRLAGGAAAIAPAPAPAATAVVPVRYPPCRSMPSLPVVMAA